MRYYRLYKWSEVLTIINGKNQRAVECKNGEYPIYGSGGVMGRAKEYLCPPNCTVIGRKGNINKPIFVDTKFWNVDTAFGLSANEEILNPRYLYYFCLDYDFERHNKAVTIPSLTKADLLKIEISLPPLNIQESIVSELDAINQLLALKRKQLEKYDQLAQSLFYEMFGDPVENEKGWEVKKFADVYRMMSDGPFGSNLKSEHYQASGVRVIRLQNIGVGTFVDKDQAYISEEHYMTLKKYSCHPGDVVIGTMGDPNLRACKIPEDITLSINKADCVHVVPDTEIIISDYIVALINTPSFVLAKSNNVHGQTRGRISYGQIKQFCLPLPPLPFQQLFANRIEAIERQKGSVKAAIAKLETLLAARMQHWFDERMDGVDG